uniref:DNA-directed DNA polymerase n=1 Tax=viral metagenome TaxID=1070528 RepID=A0A6C0BXL4_9ZZZZ
MPSAEFRVFSFETYNVCEEQESGPKIDNNNFMVQMFGINTLGETCSITIDDFKPFFFVKAEGVWSKSRIEQVKTYILDTIGEKYYEQSICGIRKVERKKLYGFDGGENHNFLEISFENTKVMNRVKNLWYDVKNKPIYSKKLKAGGLRINNNRYIIYEGNIPPLLRFFHINNISPSGWIKIKNAKSDTIDKETDCKYEYTCGIGNIVALPDKEDIVPFKICSFDIEASSSHGDFPLPVKDYKKLATNMVDIFNEFDTEKMTDIDIETIIGNIINTAFNPETNNVIEGVETIYPICRPASLALQIKQVLKYRMCPDEAVIATEYVNTIEDAFNKHDDDEPKSFHKKQQAVGLSLVEIIKTSQKMIVREIQINSINYILSKNMPKIAGDKVTFIGSTFMRYGESEPYKNTCIALDTCDPVDSAEPIICCSGEKEVLLEWTKLIKREDPDIIIGYNIFGFDYKFMFERSKELSCVEEFLKLSRKNNDNCDEDDLICGTFTEKGYKIEETSIVIASGQHDLHYIKMPGRIQIDLYNYFRRDYNLTSYKLDYVAGFFIGDGVKSISQPSPTTTKIKTKNMIGLNEGCWINFEEIGHSSEYYLEGKKFNVIDVDRANGEFTIEGVASPNLETKKVKWGMAKDDVTPQDIFRMTNEGPGPRSVIAKYCIQDCNLVQYLLNKIDIITGFVEMSKICSVPMEFLVLRGQGIKLTSYIAKKCREKNTLMPDIDKGPGDEGYEGAIVLEPKCGLYLDNPVACLDYSSLYPSSMISENLSHDSKVWTKEYTLIGELIKEIGVKDKKGEFVYDNLDGYEYVDIEYDTYKYMRKTAASATEKVISGKKVCRWAQFPNGEKGIMPSILEELLAARKATRKQIPLETDEFMKGVLDKRQLGYKVTANSLYGQTGAKTSTFYEKDVAASTTAIGRKLLTYGKRIIEEAYADRKCLTVNHGVVQVNAEYIYGDTDSVFFTFNLKDVDTGERIIGRTSIEITIELAKQLGEYASKFLKSPHDFEYEKTFYPFLLLSKKRYVGMLHENDPDVCYRSSMGIVLKRRDNAPIVKDVYGGIIDILMKEKDIGKAAEFLKSALQNIVDETYPIDKLIITKSLRSGYKNPKQIAHKVLADRIGKRDPGNKPANGDRIPFVHIKTDKKNALQGEKIELPSFIVENNLKPNYAFYITNQIMKPVMQVFALVIEKLPDMKVRQMKLRQYMREVKGTHPKNIDKIRNKYVKELLFDKYIKMAENTTNKIATIDSFFTQLNTK